MPGLNYSFKKFHFFVFLIVLCQILSRKTEGMGPMMS